MQNSTAEKYKMLTLKTYTIPSGYYLSSVIQRGQRLATFIFSKLTQTFKHKRKCFRSHTSAKRHRCGNTIHADNRKSNWLCGSFSKENIAAVLGSQIVQNHRDLRSEPILKWYRIVIVSPKLSELRKNTQNTRGRVKIPKSGSPHCSTTSLLE